MTRETISTEAKVAFVEGTWKDTMKVVDSEGKVLGKAEVIEAVKASEKQ